MFNDDRSMVLAFNGEIYNFVELRAELRSHGVDFRSRSDTEVLLKAYEHWGPAAFEKFNGMWAFALWDGRERKLIASRDRFGVKPLYHTRVDGTWVFGSEIKALLAFPGARSGASGATAWRRSSSAPTSTVTNGPSSTRSTRCHPVPTSSSTARR